MNRIKIKHKSTGKYLQGTIVSFQIIFEKGMLVLNMQEHPKPLSVPLHDVEIFVRWNQEKPKPLIKDSKGDDIVN